MIWAVSEVIVLMAIGVRLGLIWMLLIHKEKQTRFNSRRGYTGSFDERAGARRKEHPSTSASKVSRSQMRAENLDADLDAYMQDVNMDGGGDASFSNDASRAILPPQRRQIISYADTEPSAVDVATL
ncbi:hypothetical protein BASA81_017484 [Batrachochytrium salamandrivorans]|nr:hypothetical protein BASA81_017484 [Batrachochytrium salamandrivorans]